MGNIDSRLLAWDRRGLIDAVGVETYELANEGGAQLVALLGQVRAFVASPAGKAVAACNAVASVDGIDTWEMGLLFEAAPLLIVDELGRLDEAIRDGIDLTEEGHTALETAVLGQAAD